MLGIVRGRPRTHGSAIAPWSAAVAARSALRPLGRRDPPHLSARRNGHLRRHGHRVQLSEAAQELDVEAVPVDGAIYYYYEWTREDGSHELRVTRMEVS